jgi:epoxide hydrolase-like predicted phosphatase
MVVKAVVFDFGGVLMRTEDRRPRSRLAARLGMNYDELSALIFESPSAIQATKGELSAEEHWTAIQKSLALTEPEFEEVRSDFWAGDILDQDLVNFLRTLRTKYRTGLLSNAWDDLRQMIVEVWQIDDAFDQLIISAEVGLAKPEPGIYHMMARELQVEPSQTVFVDDYPRNIDGARTAGMKAIQFRSPGQALGDLQNLLAED